MKIKTSELTGAALDWAVAKCEGIDLFETEGWFYSDGKRAPFRPSSDWRQGGPIIERESVQLIPDQGATYVECVWFAGRANEDGDEFNGEGPTPLIAAMRCYVASKLGNEVGVPDELL